MRKCQNTVRQTLALGLFVSIFASVASSADPSVRSASACARTLGDYQALAFDPNGRMSIQNGGGMLNGGVCWWHSRLQRAAIYLTEFRPDLPKPTEGEARWLINLLSGMRQIVVIPGYRNFHDFTADFPHVVMRRLESWQREDGILRFQWIAGLSGSTSLRPSALQYVMERIHDMVTVQRRIPFEMLQLPGVGTHSWLIIGSQRTNEGYALQFVDSNLPDQTMTVNYRFGDINLMTPNGQAGVPYLKNEGDLGKIMNTLAYACGHAPENAAAREFVVIQQNRSPLRPQPQSITFGQPIEVDPTLGLGDDPTPVEQDER